MKLQCSLGSLNYRSQQALQMTKPAAALPHLQLDCTNDMHYIASCSFLCPCGWLFVVLYNTHEYNSVETTSNITWPAKCCLRSADMLMVSLGAHAQETIECPCNHPSDETETDLFHCNQKLHRSCNKQAQGCDHNILYTGDARQNIPSTEHMHHASFNSPLKSVSIYLHQLPTFYSMLHQSMPPTCQGNAHYLFTGASHALKSTF